MSDTGSVSVRLNFGGSEPFCCSVAADALVARPNMAEPLADVAAHVHAALSQPLQFPPFERCFVPGDQIVLAVDLQTPQLPVLLAVVWERMAQQGITAEQLTVLLSSGPLQPVSTAEADTMLQRLQSVLPGEAAEQITFRQHRPGAEDDCSYLASTLGGDRVYLAPEVVTADVVITVGSLGFDALLGYRGTNSALYPGLSTAEAVKKAQGQGHRELGPDDVRPLRQLVDEVGWLLGTQFSLQVVPGADDGVAAVLAGAYEAVLRQGTALLNEHWRTTREFRVETVVVTIDDPACNWFQLGAAVATARNLVSQDGRIVVLSSLATPPETGIQILAAVDEPQDALRPLREAAPVDLLPATQLADALSWAHVSLFSQLPEELVENLGILPIESLPQVERLLSNLDQLLILPAAQHRYATIS